MTHLRNLFRSKVASFPLSEDSVLCRHDVVRRERAFEEGDRRTPPGRPYIRLYVFASVRPSWSVGRHASNQLFEGNSSTHATDDLDCDVIDYKDDRW